MFYIFFYKIYNKNNKQIYKFLIIYIIYQNNQYINYIKKYNNNIKKLLKIFMISLILILKNSKKCYKIF